MGLCLWFNQMQLQCSTIQSDIFQSRADFAEKADDVNF
jgi:hypothetical protein